MKKQLFVLGMASVFALSGCHGIKKVEFAKFCEEVKALEEVKVESVKISGVINDGKVKFTYEIPQNLSSVVGAATGDYNKYELAAISVATMAQTPAMYTIAEAEGATYYTGLGFKVKMEDGKVEWNSKGLLASIEGKDIDLSFSWKKA